MATIKVYARIAPCSNPTNLVEVQGDRLVTAKLGRRNSQKNATELGFTFEKIFNQDAAQGEVFGTLAKDVIEKFLKGYNGTIFAYGQTGTGKTYTIEGEDLNLDTSPRHGIIPQTLALIFKEIDEMKEECVTIQISFLEMYNEMTYDLLGPLMYGNNNRRDLPRVLVTLGSGGSCGLHGLSVHDVCTEHEARRLHLKGRCNRATAWTSSNERSSRSHAVFTILLTRQKQNSEIVVRSKLNLVDLAGSERLSKTVTNGQTLSETKNINLSLHYLETVILALQKLHVQGTRTLPPKTLNKEDFRPKRCKSAYIPEHERLNNSFSSSGWNSLKSCQSTLTVSEVKRKGISLGSIGSYIPYRNSLLTMILQDSLGGNCNTAMIATLSLDSNNMNETIATCRFAQRVARVTNNPIQNKEIDEAILIKKLKNQVAKLVQDLANLKQSKSENQDSPRKESGTEVIGVIDDYIEGRIVDPTKCGIDNPQKVRACLSYLKDLLVQRNKRPPDDPTSSDESGVVLNYDHPPANDDIEGEPRRSSIGGGSEGAMPSPPPVIKTEVVKKQRRDAQLKTPALDPSQNFFPEIIASETTNISNGMTNTDNGSLEESEKQLLLMELEVKRENLIQKSKLLRTALSNQKARVVAMEKHGCPVDELDNERLAEQQLQRKQAEVQTHLTKTNKEILDTKAINCTTIVSRGSTVDHNGDVSEIQGPESISSSLLDAQAYIRRKLELKERSTRMKLLNCRQELDRGLMSTGTPEKDISKEPEVTSTEVLNENEPPFSIDEGSTQETSPIDSLDESYCSKPRRVVSSRLERLPSDVRARRVPSANLREQVSVSRRLTITDNKRKSKFGVSNCRSGVSRQSGGLQLNSSKTARKSQMINSRQSHASPSNGRASRQSYALPSNSPSKQSCALTSNGQISKQSHFSSRNSRSNQYAGGIYEETKCISKSVDRARLIRPVSDDTQVLEDVSVGPESNRNILRSRRPAMCSPALLTNRRPVKTSTRLSSTVHYEYDQSKGFIVRTNEDAYRASNFRKPAPDNITLDKEKPNQRNNNVIKKPSPKSSLSINEEQNLNHCDVTSVSRDQAKLPAIATKRDDKHTTYFRIQKKEIGSDKIRDKDPLCVSQCDRQKTPISVDEPKKALQHTLPPGIIGARKHQMERVRRIREVTNAVEVIQGAFRRYARRKMNSTRE